MSMAPAASAPLPHSAPAGTAGDGTANEGTGGDGRAFWLATAAFALLSVTLAVTSSGFLEADACSHYMIARGAWDTPAYFANVWGRPVCTGVYALPIHVAGRVGARAAALAMAVGTAAVCRAIAKGQGWRWPVLAAVFVYAQPLVFLHSFSELTELPFALLVAAAFLAYQRRQFFWVAVWVGLTPLSRPEGFALGLLAAGALVAHRRPWWLVVLGLPLLAWDVGGWTLDGRAGPWWGWLRAHWPWGQTSVYDRGNLLSFVARLPAVTGPFVLPATFVGAWLCLRGTDADSAGPHAGRLLGVSGRPGDTAAHSGSTRRARLLWSAGGVGRGFVADHRVRCAVLIVALPVAVLVGHSLLYWRGKMASNGELRYLLTVTPFWALLAGRGWGWAFDTVGWRRPRLWAGLAATLPLWCNRWYTVLPQTYSADWIQGQAIANWYQTTQAATRPLVLTSHTGVHYFLGEHPAGHRELDLNRTVVDSAPAGTVLVWDHDGALFNADAGRVITLDQVRRAGWAEVWTPWTGGVPDWHVFRSAPALPTAATTAGADGG